MVLGLLNLPAWNSDNAGMSKDNQWYHGSDIFPNAASFSPTIKGGCYEKAGFIIGNGVFFGLYRRGPGPPRPRAFWQHFKRQWPPRPCPQLGRRHPGRQWQWFPLRPLRRLTFKNRASCRRIVFLWQPLRLQPKKAIRRSFQLLKGSALDS